MKTKTEKMIVRTEREAKKWKENIAVVAAEGTKKKTSKKLVSIVSTRYCNKHRADEYVIEYMDVLQA